MALAVPSAVEEEVGKGGVAVALAAAEPTEGLEVVVVGEREGMGGGERLLAAVPVRRAEGVAVAGGGESEGLKEGRAAEVGLAPVEGLAEEVSVVLADAQTECEGRWGEGVAMGWEGVALSVAAATVPLVVAHAEGKAF